MSDGIGRTYLPPSTGLPGDRPPTREEAFEAWRRQATGVYAATRTARAPGAAAARVTGVFVALQVLAGIGLAAGLMLLPVASVPGLLTALHVIAAAVLLLAQMAGPSVMAADVVAEVGAKSSKAWASSPLPTSAWVAGKVAFYVTAQVMGSLRVLPFVASSALLGGLRVTDVLVIAGLGILWTFVTGVGVSSASLEIRPNLAARLAGRGSFLGARLAANPALRGNMPPAAALALVQLAVGIAGGFVLLPFALGNNTLSSLPGPAGLLLGALAIVSPVGAGLSAFFPQLAVRAFGVLTPLWIVSVVVVLAIAPAFLAMARLRWRPPDGATGYAVRPTLWFAWAVLCAGAFSVGATSLTAAAVLALLLPFGAAGLSALLAGVSRLPDLAAGTTGWRRVIGLDRATAEGHAMITLLVVSLALAAVTPAGTFANVGPFAGMLLVAILVTPIAFVLAAAGREGRRGIVALEAGVIQKRFFTPGAVALGLLVLGAVSPLFAAIATGLRFHGLASALGFGTLLSPIALALTVGRDMLGLQLPPGGGLPAALGAAALPLAFALQLGVGLMARKLERREAARDDVAPVSTQA